MGGGPVSTLRTFGVLAGHQRHHLVLGLTVFSFGFRFGFVVRETGVGGGGGGVVKGQRKNE